MGLGARARTLRRASLNVNCSQLRAHAWLPRDVAELSV